MVSRVSPEVAMAIPENNIRLELELLLIARGVSLNDIAVQQDIDLTLCKIVRVLEVHREAERQTAP